MGWSEYQYYTCSPEGFYYACKGYFSKLQDESLAIRNLSFIVYRLGGGKESIDNIWPLTGSEKDVPKFEVPTKEFWDKVKAAQSEVDKKIQNKNERSKNRNIR